MADVGKLNEEFLALEATRQNKRVVATFHSVRLLPLLPGATAIPAGVCDSVRRKLETLVEREAIRSCLVHRFGSDLLIQVNRIGADHYCQSPDDEVWAAIRSGLEDGSKATPDLLGALKPLMSQPIQEQCRQLRVRTLRFPFTERGAEPILVAKLISGAVGGFNRMLFNMFFHPDKGSHQRLDGTRFVALVEHVPSLLNQETRRRVYFFGDRAAEPCLHFVYPNAAGPITVEASQVGDWAELLSLIANPSEWVLSAVYAVQGRFVHDGNDWQATRHEPVALVCVQTPGSDPQSEPVLAVRLQSGLPAIGEAHFNLGGDFHLTVGGSNGGYHLAVMPTTLTEAAAGCTQPGVARICAYSYQSYDNGRIPPHHDVVDLFAQDSVQTRRLQRRATEFARLMMGHGEFQPFVTAEEAEARARDQAAKLANFFSPIPATEQGQVDEVVRRFARPGTLVLSDIKADGGGKLGHTAPPTLFVGVAQAALEEARQAGMLRSFEVFAVGDDLHLLMLHERGIDANEIHLLAFRTFWRAVWVTELLQYKPYGLAQDLKIGPATKGKKVEELAEPSEEFVNFLGRFLPDPERQALPKIEQALREWQGGRTATEVRRPFAGNVTGQGPGFAELPVFGPNTTVGLVAADKAGPAAFNLPVWFALNAVMERPQHLHTVGRSLAVEIFDVHKHRRIFLDAFYHRAEIGRLLGATNLFNVKRVWSLTQPVADPGQITQHLDQLLLSASTEKLALIAGGEYVGKDDPVLLGVPELVEPIFTLMRDGFYLTQGDERGSHYMMLSPKPLSEAVATIRSRGLEVGLRVGVHNGKHLTLQDVYAEPDFTEARDRIEALNEKLWTAQGSEFTPVGVGARDVEPAYPLMKVLRKITAADSRYGVWINK
ncbi:MAG: fructose 1,6-bisphosphatase [Candidatus Binatia bacterium]|nr:fructose 1,6-bisphosphatase [Candidatus Binatia bacterium]